MDVRLDEKGTSFTPRALKNAVLALVVTAEQLIVGFIHVRPSSRLSDELNSDATAFLSITDASIYRTGQEQLLYRTEFIVVAYSRILFITELELLADIRQVPWNGIAIEQDAETQPAVPATNTAYVDRKGKVFSPHIPKDALAAVLSMADHLLVGYVHVRADRRLKDQLDEASTRLLPLTDAKVFRSSDHTLLYRASFMLVAKAHLLSVSPIEALVDAATLPWLTETLTLQSSQAHVGAAPESHQNEQE